MSISKTSDLYRLVNSLSSSEKRTFRLYAERIHNSDALLYMKLFDLIDKQKVKDEALLLNKLDNINKTKFSNLKRHLYEQILVSLRMVSKIHKPNVRIRELLDFAYILYGKGLYLESLKILKKAKSLAEKHHLDLMTLNIVEVEKMIHSRHITRSKLEDLETMLNMAEQKSRAIANRVILSNLRLRLHKFYIENGHVKNREDEEKVKQVFGELNTISVELLSYMEQVYYYQSQIWFYYILNDFKACFISASALVNLLQTDNDLAVRDINLLFRTYHYLLTSAYNTRNIEGHRKHLQILESFRKDNYERFNYNTKIISFMYVHLGRLNQHFLDGSFDEGIELIQNRTLKRLERYAATLDAHKLMIFYYKIAWMYIGCGKPDKSIFYLQTIINMSNSALRKDIQAYARVMFLMAHFDMDNEYIIPTLVKNYWRYFHKDREAHKEPIEFLRFFKDYYRAALDHRRTIIYEYSRQFTEMQQNKYGKRAFLYLDIVPWLKAKTERRPLNEIYEETIL